MKLGIISDTHGHLDPKVPKLFEGVEHILHAGDIGPLSIILALEQIAPVTAVLGNNDAGLPLGETEVILLTGRKFLIHHIVDVTAPHETIARRIEREQPDAVIFGHSHRAFAQTIGHTLYFNPGYAGRPRFNLQRSAAILHCDDSSLSHEFIPL